MYVHDFDEFWNDGNGGFSDHGGAVLAELVVHFDDGVEVAGGLFGLVEDGEERADADSIEKRSTARLGSEPFAVVHVNRGGLDVFVDFLGTQRFADLEDGFRRLCGEEMGWDGYGFAHGDFLHGAQFLENIQDIIGVLGTTH